MQRPRVECSFFVTPYLWLSGINATTKTPLAREPEVNSDVSAIDLLSHMSGVPFMGSAEIRDGPFGLLGEVIRTHDVLFRWWRRWLLEAGKIGGRFQPLLRMPCGCRSVRGARKLDLGPVAHCAKHSNPRDGCGADGPLGGANPGPAGDPEPWSAVCDSDRDWGGRSGWAATGCAARDRGRDLGGRVFVVGRAGFAYRCDALFRRLDDHERRLGTNAATALADDGRVGGGRRHATVRYQHGLHFLGYAGVLADPLPSSLPTGALA